MDSGEELEPPFIANDQGDLRAFDRLSAHGIESFDASNTEVFDSRGRILRPVIEGFGVRYEADPTKIPDPDRLADLLRAFFRRMKKKSHLNYRTEAESCRSLDELVALLVRWSNRG